MTSSVSTSVDVRISHVKIRNEFSFHSNFFQCTHSSSCLRSFTPVSLLHFVCFHSLFLVLVHAIRNLCPCYCCTWTEHLCLVSGKINCLRNIDMTHNENYCVFDERKKQQQLKPKTTEEKLYTFRFTNAEHPFRLFFFESIFFPVPFIVHFYQVCFFTKSICLLTCFTLVVCSFFSSSFFCCCCASLFNQSFAFPSK